MKLWENPYFIATKRLQSTWENAWIYNSSKLRNDTVDKSRRENGLDKIPICHDSVWMATAGHLSEQDLRAQVNPINQPECSLGFLFSHSIPVETVLKETEGVVVVSSNETEPAAKEKSHALYLLPSSSAFEMSDESPPVKNCWQNNILGCNSAETVSAHFHCKARPKNNIQQKRQDPMYKEQERLRQRNMMQMKRQDPLFRALEREKERFRMRARRLDPVFRAQERERQRRRMQMKRQDPAFRERERQRQKSRMQLKRQNPSYKEQERVRDRLRMRIRRQIDGYKILTSKEEPPASNAPSRNNSCMAHNLKESCSCENCSGTVLNLDHNSTVSNIGLSASRILLKESIEALAQKDDRGKIDPESLSYNSPYPLLFNFYSSAKEASNSTHTSSKSNQKAISGAKCCSNSSLSVPAFPSRPQLPLPHDSNTLSEKVAGIVTGHLPFSSHSAVKSPYLPSAESEQ